MTQQFDGANAGTSGLLKERTAEQVWGAFDRLPPGVRRLLWTAPFNQDEVQLESLVREARDMGWPEDKIVRWIMAAIRDDATENVGDWGPGYPRIPFSPIMARQGRKPRGTLRILR